MLHPKILGVPDDDDDDGNDDDDTNPCEYSITVILPPKRVHLEIYHCGIVLE